MEMDFRLRTKDSLFLEDSWQTFTDMKYDLNNFKYSEVIRVGTIQKILHVILLLIILLI